MRWKQFFTPVKSMKSEKARELIKGKTSDELMIIDVRQPKEYEEGHIPGSKLIPLPDLDRRLDEIDPGKTALVYCAIGGRSRVASQLLAGKGFDNIIDLSGGFKAWKGEAAYGGVDLGLELFSGNESPEHTLAVAYSLEEGLREFYISMAIKVENHAAKALFEKLSGIEVKHQNRIYDEYEKITKNPVTRNEFTKEIVGEAIEGGLTTEEYINMINPDWESALSIIEIAMTIEAQALDLYHRASERTDDERSKKALGQLADEERAHLKELGKLLETL
jgi:rhodanese-related sulfurtransferase/rubrerythrin